MAEETGGEKTLPASPRKLERAREDGNVARSQDLSAGASLTVALVAMYLLGPDMMRGVVEMGRHFLGQAHLLTADQTPVAALAAQTVYTLARVVLPFALVMLLAGLVFSFAQVGVLFTVKPLQPKMSRINPVTGFKKFVSMRALVELIKSLAKLAIVGGIVYWTFRDRRDEIVALMALDPWPMAVAVGELVMSVWWRIALLMIVVGVADFGFQYWQRQRDLRMTVQEARQESKEMEGDPQIKRRVRQLQRQIAMQRMMGEVPKAEVVITNPTHYAVALRYDMETMKAPVVVAKGARLLAQRIRDIAVEHDVPIVQKPDLARTLYRTLEPGQPIPEDLFRAVAEVLSYVYEIDRREEKRKERMLVASG